MLANHAPSQAAGSSPPRHSRARCCCPSTPAASRPPPRGLHAAACGHTQRRHRGPDALARTKAGLAPRVAAHLLFARCASAATASSRPTVGKHGQSPTIALRIGDARARRLVCHEGSPRGSAARTIAMREKRSSPLMLLSRTSGHYGTGVRSNADFCFSATRRRSGSHALTAESATNETRLEPAADPPGTQP
jgi:hypothetical protein